jgi:pilus assembly protein CpaB
MAAAAAAGCVLAVVHELAPPEPETTAVVVAARDLAPGTRLETDDLRLARVSPDTVPEGAVTAVEQLTGEQLTGPLHGGEVLTDARVLSPELVGQYGDGLVATPVRLPDADVVALLEAGDRVDVYAATGDLGEPADQVVSAARVITVPANDGRQGEGAVVVLALSESDTARLAQASATTLLSISMRRGAIDDAARLIP